jgi:hypothetical protein
LAIQLRRDLIPTLDKHGVDLVAVSIGTSERAKDFVRETGFPAERLFADPESAAYDALRLNKSLANFSQKSTPEGIMARIQRDGAADLLGVLRRWKPWIPPKPEQGFQQGGAFVFDFSELSDERSDSDGKTLYRFYDPSTGVSAPFDDMLLAAGLEPLGREVKRVPREEREKARAEKR